MSPGNGLLVMALALQVAVPLMLMAWIAAGVRRTPTELALDGLVGMTWIAATALSGLWLAVPWWVAPLLGAMLLATLAITLQRRARRAAVPAPAYPVSRVSPRLVDRERRMIRRLRIGARLLVVAGGGMVMLNAFSARIVPNGVVDLAFPLEPGAYLVASGGSTTLVNPHRTLPARPGAAAFRGQGWAVDLVARGGWGSRRRAPNPSDPAGFAIFGARVLAPCDGRVIAARNDRPDMPVPVRDRDVLEGNHVVLDCGAVWVLLAHLMQGSVRVENGAYVREGDVLGLVGNSGQSDEPHLHVHVQTPGTPSALLSGDPVPARFGGYWLVRNQRVAGR